VVEETSAEKQCATCGERKPLEEFYPFRTGKYGRHAKCKPCYKAYNRERRKRVPYERYRVQILASAKARRAYRAGRLPRPLRCMECGTPCRETQAHHEDYSKPLDVVWLCPPCHRAKHWQFARGPRTEIAGV
jgi:hypothetical protein